MSVAFLQNASGWRSAFPSARLFVEWAPGADVNDADGSGWTWVDISSDVLWSDGNAINISPIGRSDYASQSQPAGMQLTLKNTTGKYSRGPQSTYYPNVKLNTPVKVSISLDGTTPSKVIRFQGFIYELKPNFDATGGYAVVSLRAAGVTRRLQHGSPELRSSLYRAYTRDAAVVAYWPMEDQVGSSYFSSAAGQQVMNYTGATLESDSSHFSGSDSLPVFAATGTYAASLSYKFTSNWEVNFLLVVPAAVAADTAIMRIHTRGSQVGRWEIVITAGTASTLRVDGYANNATISTTKTTAFGYAAGTPLSVRFMAKQNGATVDYLLVVFPADFSSGGLTSGTQNVLATTVGDVTQLSCLAAAGMANLVMGHFVVFDTYNHTNTDLAFIGFAGGSVLSVGTESPTTRATRLTTEEAVDFVATSTAYSEDRMGKQTQISLMSLLREAEVVDTSILYDGKGPGLHWTSFADIQNQAAAVSFIPADLVPEFEPVEDDFDFVNRQTVARKNGTTAQYEETSGGLGTAAIGFYDDSLSGLNTFYDYRSLDFASWMVHRGTVEGYRYPRINVDLRRIASKATAFLTMRPGSRFDITAIENYVSQLPNGDVQLVMLGYTEVLSQTHWSATLNCEPYSIWVVGKLDDASGTYAATASSYDTDLSTLNTSATLNATSISVATSGGLRWTTAAADLPLYINVGGWRVSVTAISGASSPQTFTISALPGAVTAGAQVKLWTPASYAL